MGHLDAGAILIVVLLLAGGAWALYNWTHAGTHSSK
jgi:hypothetical protein